MKNFVATAISATSAAALFAVAPVLASDTTEQDGSTKADTPEIVKTNAQGKATQVRIDGKVYDVCMNDEQDDCINPRAAGLNWGDRPLDYWPGKPASSM